MVTLEQGIKNILNRYEWVKPPIKERLKNVVTELYNYVTSMFSEDLITDIHICTNDAYADMLLSEDGYAFDILIDVDYNDFSIYFRPYMTYNTYNILHYEIDENVGFYKEEHPDTDLSDEEIYNLDEIYEDIDITCDLDGISFDIYHDYNNIINDLCFEFNEYIKKYQYMNSLAGLYVLFYINGYKKRQIDEDTIYNCVFDLITLNFCYADVDVKKHINTTFDKFLSIEGFIIG